MESRIDLLILENYSVQFSRHTRPTKIRLFFEKGTTDSRSKAAAVDEMISGILSEMLSSEETKASLLESGRLVYSFLFFKDCF